MCVQSCASQWLLPIREQDFGMFTCQSPHYNMASIISRIADLDMEFSQHLFSNFKCLYVATHHSEHGQNLLLFLDHESTLLQLLMWHVVGLAGALAAGLDCGPLSMNPQCRLSAAISETCIPLGCF
jgi:hypothetical protein